MLGAYPSEASRGKSGWRIIGMKNSRGLLEPIPQRSPALLSFARERPCSSFFVSLFIAALAVPWAVGAESRKSSANHAPGFVTPTPNEVIRLWPGDAPNLVPGGRSETVVNERYRNVSLPQLFVYLPPNDKARGTALIICAGGGYRHLGMCIHVENIVKLFNDQGIAVFGLKYRTKYGDNDVIEDALADGKRAVRIVRSRAAEWGIDPKRIGVQGYSAGGNLCLNLASRYDQGDPGSDDPLERLSSRPDFVVLMCPWPYTQKLDDFPFDKNSPPTFIASAKDDTTAPNSFAVAIDERLKGLEFGRRSGENTETTGGLPD